VAGYPAPAPPVAARQAEPAAEAALGGGPVVLTPEDIGVSDDTLSEALSGGNAIPIDDSSSTQSSASVDIKTASAASVSDSEPTASSTQPANNLNDIAAETPQDPPSKGEYEAANVHSDTVADAPVNLEEGPPGSEGLAKRDGVVAGILKAAAGAVTSALSPSPSPSPSVSASLSSPTADPITPLELEPWQLRNLPHVKNPVEESGATPLAKRDIADIADEAYAAASHTYEKVSDVLSGLPDTAASLLSDILPSDRTDATLTNIRSVKRRFFHKRGEADETSVQNADGDPASWVNAASDDTWVDAASADDGSSDGTDQAVVDDSSTNPEDASTSPVAATLATKTCPAISVPVGNAWGECWNGPFHSLATKRCKKTRPEKPSNCWEWAKIVDGPTVLMWDILAKYPNCCRQPAGLSVQQAQTAKRVWGANKLTDPSAELVDVQWSKLKTTSPSITKYGITAPTPHPAAGTSFFTAGSTQYTLMYQLVPVTLTDSPTYYNASGFFGALTADSGSAVAVMNVEFITADGVDMDSVVSIGGVDSGAAARANVKPLTMIYDDAVGVVPAGTYLVRVLVEFVPGKGLSINNAACDLLSFQLST